MEMIQKFILSFSFLFLFAGISFAQAQNPPNEADQLVTVAKKYVSQDGLSAAQSTQTQTTVSGWIGIGHEIGQAFKEGFSSFTDETNRFSQTQLGKLTMFIIVFKTVGVSIIRIMFAFTLALAGLLIWINAFKKNCLPSKMLSKEIINEAGKVTERQYQLKDAKFDEGVQFAYAVVLFVYMGFCALIGFLG